MIQGKQKEQQDYGKVIGLAEVKVLAFNPTREEFKNVLNRELDEESKADQYLGEAKDTGNATVRIDAWVEVLKLKRKEKITFFLEDCKRMNKDGSKTQYINNIGMCAWADAEENLPDWFKRREYREAFKGEEDFYSLLRSWLGNLDYKDKDTVLELKWKDLLKGNLKDLKSLINSSLSTTFVTAFTVRSIEKEGDIKEYQSAYNRVFLPNYCLKQFRVVDYNKSEIQSSLRKRKPKDLKPHERLVVQMSDSEHGCKDSYFFGDIKDYDPNDFLVASDAPISSDGSDY